LAYAVVIVRWFHFPPHLSIATVLPWKMREHKNDKFRHLQRYEHDNSLNVFTA